MLNNTSISYFFFKISDIIADVSVSCDVIVEVQTLPEASSLTSTPSSGNQSSRIAISFKTQTNLGSQTQQYQSDDRSLQTLNNEIPSTSTQPPILGNQNLMNQTNIIERNNFERGRGQQVAVVTSDGLMRNSYNPADDQAGAMTSCSSEFSSNNISTGNDQIGQSSIGTDAEPYISSVNNERVHDLENKRGMI